MNLRIKAAKDEAGEVIPENFVIEELAAGTDADGNPITVVAKSGQHTIESVLGNIYGIQKQIDGLFEEQEKWEKYKELIECFLTE